MAPTRCLSCMKQIDTPVCPHCGYPERECNDAHQLRVGTSLRRRYQVGKALGQGGFGITYLGWDEAFRQTVAIKEFYPSSLVNRQKGDGNAVFLNSTAAEAGFRSGRERFLREAQALSRLAHIPEIVHISDFFEENNTAYIVMEYVRGVELAQYVSHKGGRLEPEETFRILEPIVRALETVHKQGLVHRDISPDNIMLEAEGGVKLLDFGAVRVVENPEAGKDLEKSTEAILKHGFAPAEQYRGRGSLGPWTDLYALCATVYYCLTGTVPPDSLGIAMGEEELDWNAVPGLTDAQRRALTKGMAPRAEQRYKDLGQLRRALYGAEAEPSEEAAREEPEELPDLPESKEGGHQMPETENVTFDVQPSRKAPQKKRRKRKLWLLPAALLAAAAVAVGLTMAESKPSQEDRYNQAQQQYEAGDYLLAAESFAALGDYQDSAERADSCRYSAAAGLMEREDYEAAAAAFDALGAYRDSADRAAQCRNALTYAEALAARDRGAYSEAAALYASLGDYSDSAEQAVFCENMAAYAQAEQLLQEGSLLEAAARFYSLGEFQDSRQRAFGCLRGLPNPLSGGSHSVAILSDGTVTVAGSNLYGQCNVSDWRSVVAISAGGAHTVGLKADGSVIAAGLNIDGRCDVSSWRDIIAISAGGFHTAGLRADGTVVATGDSDYGQCAVSSWRNIVAVETGGFHTVGLKADGTVVAVGANDYGQCDVSSWRDIVAVSAGGSHTIGLRADGTVVAAGKNTEGQCDVSSWRDIVAISSGYDHSVGLKVDGTAVAVGANGEGQCDVSLWENLVAIVAGYHHTLGITEDGTLVAVGRNDAGQCDVFTWKDLLLPN